MPMQARFDDFLSQNSPSEKAGSIVDAERQEKHLHTKHKTQSAMACISHKNRFRVAKKRSNSTRQRVEEAEP